MVHPKTQMFFEIFFAMGHLVGPSPKMYEISPSPQGEIILFFTFTLTQMEMDIGHLHE